MKIKRLKIIGFLVLIFFATSCNKIKHYEWIDKAGFLVKMDVIGDTSKEYDGEVKTYYPTGELFQEGHIKGNLQEGLEREYFKNGKISKLYYFTHGKRNGIHQAFYPNGNVKVTATYQNDALNGFRAFYYPSGFLKNYILFVKDTQIYYGLYDSTGRQLKNDWSIYINYSKKISLGQKLEVTIQLPVIKGDYDPQDFRSGIYLRNISNTDTLYKYVLNGGVDSNSNTWTYYLRDKEKKSTPLYISGEEITIDNEGKGVFTYTPANKGEYNFKVVVCHLQHNGYIDSQHFNIEFRVD